jgi:hypothetical protein
LRNILMGCENIEAVTITLVKDTTYTGTRLDSDILT